jgi:hypothetical protein
MILIDRIPIIPKFAIPQLIIVDLEPFNDQKGGPPCPPDSAHRVAQKTVGTEADSTDT